MKTSTLLLSMFCLVVFSSFGQHTHEGIEHHFESKGLLVLEHDLHLTQADYSNSELVRYVNLAYQRFHSKIEKKLSLGIDISDEEFASYYASFVTRVRKEIDAIQPSPFEETTKMENGPCENMDFETGDFTGWTLTMGDVLTPTGPYSYENETVIGPGAFHFVNGPGVDPITGISRVNPAGGSFSAMIGDSTGIGARAARLTQTFLVDATNYVFTYSYAVVFQSPTGHNLNQLPYFTVRVLDSLGNGIPCGEYMVIADAANASDYEETTWTNPINGSFSAVLYKDWTTVFTNLSAYIGQNVTIEFTAGDCSLTGHFGYAYVDASCGIEQLTATNDIICPGDSSVLSAPSGASAYLWSNGATTQMTTVYAGGLYSCTITPYQGGACDLVLDITISENPAPIANFSHTLINCLGDVTNFTNLSSIVAPGVLTGYQWDFGDGIVTPMSTGNIVGIPATTGTFLAPSHVYAASGIYNVQLLIQSSDGCLDSISILVSVNTPPIVVAGPDLEVCDGEQVTLMASGATNYLWDHGIMNGVPFMAPMGSTTYTVIGTDINGCSDSDQLVVTVNALPVVNAGPDQSGCDGLIVTLAGSGAANYVWDNGVVNGIPFQPNVGTVNYTVIGTDVNGCSSMDNVNVTINDLPVITASDVVICEGDSVILTAQGATTYTWSGGIQNGVPFYPTESALYVVTGTNIHGCSATDTVSVIVNPSPTAAFQILNLDLTTSYSTTGFNNQSNGATSYQWNFGDGSSLSSEFEPIHTFPYTQSGEYEIILTAYSAEGCPSQAIKYVHVFQDYIIYVPNAFTPDGDGVNQVFKPEMEGFDEDEYTLYIFNRWGQLIFESHSMEVGWDGKFAGQDYQTQDGVYTWKIIAGIKDSADSKIFVGHVSLLK